MTTMRAMVCERLGGPEALHLREMPSPQARDSKVVVSLHAAAINFPDILTIAGTYQHKQTPPFVPGHEGAGIVSAVGSKADESWLGKSVMVAARGCYAEKIAVPADALMALPPRWAFTEGAAFPVVGRTAYHALVHRARLQAGETLLVNGASGGTGHLAVKLGKALGARVIATGADAGKLAKIREIGADETVVLGGTDDAGRIKEATGGTGVDVVFDPVGGPAFEAALKACRFGARVLVIGFTSGTHNTVRTNYALIKGLSILGVRAGEAARHDLAIQADYDRELPRLAAAFDIKPVIAATYPLAQAAAALRTLQSRKLVGKIVLTMNETLL